MNGSNVLARRSLVFQSKIPIGKLKKDQILVKRIFFMDKTCMKALKRPE
jgi:hypothetical protein